MDKEVLLEGLCLGPEQVLLLGAVGDGVGLHNNFNIKDRRIIHPITPAGGSIDPADALMSVGSASRVSSAA